jgi:hypothetical protein
VAIYAIQHLKLAMIVWGRPSHQIIYSPTVWIRGTDAEPAWCSCSSSSHSLRNASVSPSSSMEYSLICPWIHLFYIHTSIYQQVHACSWTHNHQTGHPHQQQLGVGAARRSRAYSLTDTTLDEIKLRLKFCTQRVCDKRLCYCCWNEKPESLCYGNWQECKNECPLCNPKCPPGQSTTAWWWSGLKTVSTSKLNDVLQMIDSNKKLSIC